MQPDAPAFPAADPAPIPYVAGAPGYWGCCNAMAPARVAATLTLAGVPARPLRRVLHLGCGRGVTLAILAAMGVRCHGVTADETEAAAARGVAAAAGLRIDIACADLVAFCNRDDLPMFDLIAMPAGWSLTGQAGRAAIVGLLARKLAPGGVFHLLHAVMPGAAEEAPLRQLARNRWLALPDDMPDAARAKAALADLEAALRQCHGLFRAYGGFDAHLAQLRALPPALAARDWFGAEWAPGSIRDLGARLRPAGLTRLAPADPARLARDLDFSPDQQALIDAAPDPWLRAELADLLSRRLTRADHFIREGGPAAAPPLGDLRLQLADDPDHFDHRVEGLLGAACLSRAAYDPLIAALSPRRACRLAEVAATLAATPESLAERVAVLIGAGLVAPAPPEAEAAAAAPACARLNAVFAALAAAGQGLRALAAPALGAGIEVAAQDMRFLHAVFAHPPGTAPGAEALARAGAGPDAGAQGAEGLARRLAQAELRRSAAAFLGAPLAQLRRFGALG